jgi:hypothetical protein
MEMAFYQGRKRLTNRLIADLTGGPFSHVEMILERYQKGWALCVSASMMDGGVRVKLINIGTPDWVVVSVNVEVSLDDAWSWFWLHSGEQYDYTGALRYRLPFLKQNPKKKYCSEAVSEILRLPKSNHPNGLYKELLRYAA